MAPTALSHGDRVDFWLGTHKAHWLEIADVPLMVSHRTLSTRKTLPRAQVPWVLDSGGFSELSLFGHWETSANEYVEAVECYADQIGNLRWAAVQDWMCEPHILRKTALSIEEHQVRSIISYLEPPAARA